MVEFQFWGFMEFAWRRYHETQVFHNAVFIYSLGNGELKQLFFEIKS